MLFRSRDGDHRDLHGTSHSFPTRRSSDPRRVKRIRIVRLKERRDRPREQQRKRQEPDAVLAGTTPPQLATDDTPKDDGRAAATPVGTRRP